MTPQEQLKIYAAYLPYGLIVKKKFSRYSPTKTEVMNIDDLKTFGICKIFKPILYDLSYLTKEIEHEGERVNMQERMQHLDFEWLIGNPKLAAKLNQEDFETLVKYHFNVFGIPAGDFIEKSTLKTESNE